MRNTFVRHKGLITLGPLCEGKREFLCYYLFLSYRPSSCFFRVRRHKDSKRRESMEFHNYLDPYSEQEFRQKFTFPFWSKQEGDKEKRN